MVENSETTYSPEQALCNKSLSKIDRFLTFCILQNKLSDILFTISDGLTDSAEINSINIGSFYKVIHNYWDDSCKNICIKCSSCVFGDRILAKELESLSHQPQIIF